MPAYNFLFNVLVEEILTNIVAMVREANKINKISLVWNLGIGNGEGRPATTFLAPVFIPN